jgi:arabinogalactan oligomer/maltooligosaccharide transport system permease protein
MQPEKQKTDALDGNSTVFTILKYVAFCIAVAFALIIVYALVASGNWPFAVAVAAAAIVATVATLVDNLYPIRWMVPGFVFVIIIVIYPIFYTFYTSFTNYGDGHNETKEQVISRFLYLTQPYIPADAPSYNAVMFRKEDDPTAVALWLSRELEDGTVEVSFAPVAEPITVIEGASAEAPETYEGYVRITALPERIAIVGQELTFGTGDNTVELRELTVAAKAAPRYVYDPVEDTLLDQETNTVYYANDEEGYFETSTKQLLVGGGYSVLVGLENYTVFLTDPRLQGPLLTIFIWTVMFAFLSVFTTFSLGLFLAIILNDAKLPGKKIVRSLLIIPYAMPGIISITIWRGMLNQELGIITAFLNSLGLNPLWFQDTSLGGGWTRFAVILVNLWLGYPYMMLICSGALQSIPTDIYEAAAVDGASPFQRFWQITLPLLLVAVGPLLIGSFVFNFNNFILIEALTQGNPPIPNSPTPAGYTDILINYVYSLAFDSGSGVNYGYASAITIIIFLIVASITVFQYRFTRTLEEVGKNV